MCSLFSYPKRENISEAGKEEVRRAVGRSVRRMWERGGWMDGWMRTRLEAWGLMRAVVSRQIESGESGREERFVNGASSRRGDMMMMWRMEGGEERERKEGKRRKKREIGRGGKGSWREG
jgi:hypothetical protein